MGFFNLYKPREYGYRYIYYDPKKEEKKIKERERLRESATDEPQQRTLRRGVFREMADKNKNFRLEQMRKSNLRLVIILFAMLAALYYLLSY